MRKYDSFTALYQVCWVGADRWGMTITVHIGMYAIKTYCCDSRSLYPWNLYNLMLIICNTKHKTIIEVKPHSRLHYSQWSSLCSVFVEKNVENHGPPAPAALDLMMMQF